MKIIINQCYGGFEVREDIAKALGYKWNDDEELRTDARLIKMIEDGENVNGDYADLMVVEVPEGATDWEFTEYDGAEGITYVLDGKLNHL